MPDMLYLDTEMKTGCDAATVVDGIQGTGG